MLAGILEDFKHCLHSVAFHSGYQNCQRVSGIRAGVIIDDIVENWGK